MATATTDPKTSWRPLTSIHNYTVQIPFWTYEQEQGFLLSHLQKLFALFMDPRTGKSKIIVDTACYHYERKSSPLHITGVLIIAWPNGVHRGWITDAFPQSVPSRIKWSGLAWNSKLANRVGYQKQFAALCSFDGLAVFTINAEAIPFETTRKAIGSFIKARAKVAVIADESSFMVTPKARRQRVMHNISKLSQVIWKRILDGTPVGKAGPTDYFTQIRFLSPSILGFSTMVEFRNHYCDMETQGDWVYREAYDKALQSAAEEAILAGKDEEWVRLTAENQAKGRGKSWPAIRKDEKGEPIFRNMDELWQRLAPYTYRATFDQCFDTPRKVYQKRVFELSDTQRQVYDQLRDEYKAELGDTTIEAPDVLSRMLRLQQIASNYYPEQIIATPHPACKGQGCEDCDYLGVKETTTPLKIIDPKHNPRLEALREEYKIGRPLIVWARFRQDVGQCYALAEEMGLSPVRYDGKVGPDQKAKAIVDFQAGRSNAFVANCGPTSGATRGISLWKAYGHVYYSNSYGMRTREQSEQRTEIKHRTVGTAVIDLVAADTVDDLSIIPGLRSGMGVAAYVMKDGGKTWL